MYNKKCMELIEEKATPKRLDNVFSILEILLENENNPRLDRKIIAKELGLSWNGSEGSTARLISRELQLLVDLNIIKRLDPPHCIIVEFNKDYFN